GRVARRPRPRRRRSASSARSAAWLRASPRTWWPWRATPSPTSTRWPASGSCSPTANRSSTGSAPPGADSPPDPRGDQRERRADRVDRDVAEARRSRHGEELAPFVHAGPADRNDERPLRGGAGAGVAAPRERAVPEERQGGVLAEVRELSDADVERRELTDGYPRQEPPEQRDQQRARVGRAPGVRREPQDDAHPEDGRSPIGGSQRRSAAHEGGRVSRSRRRGARR